MDEAFTWFLALFPKIKKSAGLGPRSAAEGRVKVPRIQFILRVADVPVVQSIPLGQNWPRCSSLTVVDVRVVLVIDAVVLSLEARRRGGVAGAGGGPPGRV